MSDGTCRWGILSAAGIALKNWHSIANSGNGQVVAVASRSAEKADRFIKTCQSSAPVEHIVDGVEGYDALLDRDDIDAVYIPLPTGIRAEWVIKAANAGKHVLVEKPVGTSAETVREMIAACAANNVQFMDGVMFMHSDRMPAMRKVLDDGSSVGDIRRIASQFSFCADEEWVSSNIRSSSSLEPAGCLGDLGWYTIRMTLWAMNFEMPTEVRGRILHGAGRPDSPDTVPMEFQGEMHFASGVSATFFNSFRTNHQQWTHISGNKGYLEVKDFVLPYLGNTSEFDVANHDFVGDGCRFNMEKRQQTLGVQEFSNNHQTAQETKLFRTFADLVLSGKTNGFWPDITLKTQLVMDAALRSARQNGETQTPE